MRVGEHTLSTPIDCWTKNECAPKPQDFVPTKIIPHESYNGPNPFQHDIALLKLDRPVVRNGQSISKLQFHRQTFKGVLKGHNSLKAPFSYHFPYTFQG